MERSNVIRSFAIGSFGFLATEALTSSGNAKAPRAAATNGKECERMGDADPELCQLVLPHAQSNQYPQRQEPCGCVVIPTGTDRERWTAYDVGLLMRETRYPGPILVDQGLNDQFLDSRLRPETFEACARTSGQSPSLRRHGGRSSIWTAVNLETSQSRFRPPNMDI